MLRRSRGAVCRFLQRQPSINLASYASRAIGNRLATAERERDYRLRPPPRPPTPLPSPPHSFAPSPQTWLFFTWCSSSPPSPSPQAPRRAPPSLIMCSSTCRSAASRPGAWSSACSEKPSLRPRKTSSTSRCTRRDSATRIASSTGSSRGSWPKEVISRTGTEPVESPFTAPSLTTKTLTCNTLAVGCSLWPMRAPTPTERNSLSLSKTRRG